MKILHLIYDHINNPWVGGGGAVRTYEINKRLAEKGHEFTIVSGKYPRAKDYEEGNLKFKFVGYDKNYVISVFSYVYNSFNFTKKHAKEYDIIVEDFAPWNPVFANFFHNKVILQLHHKEGINILKKYFVAGLPYYLIEKLYPKIFSNIIAVSKETNNKYGVDAKVIPNGIPDYFIFQRSKIGEYIAFIGRIDIHNKGLDLLLEATCHVKTKVLIAGKGKDENRLIKMINNLNSPNIQYVGFLTEENKILFISNSKFLIMPSRYEGQGIVALEAAAMGKPLIVSDISELRYVVDNGFGISFPSGDVKSLRQAIEYMLNNEALIEEMGKRGRQYARQFTWDKIAEEYERYLLEILNN